jgi:hypothetical protein
MSNGVRFVATLPIVGEQVGNDVARARDVLRVEAAVILDHLVSQMSSNL